MGNPKTWLNNSTHLNTVELQKHGFLITKKNGENARDNFVPVG